MRTHKTVQTPTHEIEWDNRKATMDKIKAGTAVWLGDGSFPCKGGIAVVSRTTATQFVVDKSEEYSAERRFKRENGFRVGGGMFSEFITGIATKEEIDAYRAERAAAKAAATRRRNEQERVENVQKELNSMFTDDEPIFVRAEEFKDDSTFTITISGLTADQVRALAPKFKKAVAGK